MPANQPQYLRATTHIIFATTRWICGGCSPLKTLAWTGLHLGNIGGYTTYLPPPHFLSTVRKFSPVPHPPISFTHVFLCQPTAMEPLARPGLRRVGRGPGFPFPNSTLLVLQNLIAAVLLFLLTSLGCWILAGNDQVLNTHTHFVIFVQRTPPPPFEKNVARVLFVWP